MHNKTCLVICTLSSQKQQTKRAFTTAYTPTRATQPKHHCHALLYYLEYRGYFLFQSQTFTMSGPVWNCTNYYHNTTFIFLFNQPSHLKYSFRYRSSRFFFTDRMPFLSPNQHCLCTKGRFQNHSEGLSRPPCLKSHLSVLTAIVQVNLD